MGLLAPAAVGEMMGLTTLAPGGMGITVRSTMGLMEMMGLTTLAPGFEEPCPVNDEPAGWP